MQDSSAYMLVTGCLLALGLTLGPIVYLAVIFNFVTVPAFFGVMIILGFIVFFGGIGHAVFTLRELQKVPERLKDDEMYFNVYVSLQSMKSMIFICFLLSVWPLLHLVRNDVWPSDLICALLSFASSLYVSLYVFAFETSLAADKSVEVSQSRLNRGFFIAGGVAALHVGLCLLARYA